MGMYQKDIARIIEVSTDSITNWEKGRTKPYRKNVSKIELFLETSSPTFQDAIDNKQAKSYGCRLGW